MGRGSSVFASLVSLHLRYIDSVLAWDNYPSLGAAAQLRAGGGFLGVFSAVPRVTESPGSGGDVAQQGWPVAGLTLYFSFLFPCCSPTTSERR